MKTTLKYYISTALILVCGNIYSWDGVVAGNETMCKPFIAHLKNRYSIDGDKSNTIVNQVKICTLKSAGKKLLYVDTTNQAIKTSSLLVSKNSTFDFEDSTSGIYDSRNLCLITGSTVNRDGKAIEFVGLSNQIPLGQAKNPENQGGGFIAVEEGPELKFDLNASTDQLFSSSLTLGPAGESVRLQTTIQYSSDRKELRYQQVSRNSLFTSSVKELLGNRPKQDFIFECR